MKKLISALVLALIGLSLQAGEVVVLPASGVVGESEPYKILVSDFHSPVRGSFVFRFPEGFDLRPVKEVKAFLEDGSAGLFSVENFKVENRKIEINFRNYSTAFSQTVLFELDKVLNSSKAGNFEIKAMVVDANQSVESFSLTSEPLILLSSKAHQVSILPPKVETLRAGESIELKALTQDRFGNPVENFSVAWRLPGASTGDGNFVGNRFFATRSGQVEIFAYSGELSSLPLTFSVVAGSLDRFDLTGVPDSTVAGVPFPVPAANVTVRARDTLDNIVTTFADTVFFSSEDPQAVLPPPYVFTSGVGKDNGSHTFPGSQFVLKTAGNKRISVSSDGKIGSSLPVRVKANILVNFLLLANPDVLAGVPFDANVLGGVDLYGNPASGAVTISAASGGGPSPNGTFPTLSPIIVVSGSGTSKQTLFATTPTILRGTVGAISRLSNNINVRPAGLGTFLLSPLPGTLTAGDSVATFQAEVQDRFRNLKTDYLGNAYFSSSDSRAILQYPASNPYTFAVADSGRHTFRGSSVKFLTKGTQTLTFGIDTLRSPPVTFTIVPAPPSSFSVSAPATVEAGAPFSVLVQNVVDAYGNPVSLTVQIALKNSDGIASDSTGPVLPLVSVIDGSGQGTAILPKAEKVVLEGISGALRFSSDTVLVTPAALVRFDFFLTSPQISGVPFSPPATLTARDQFKNLKDNFNAVSDSVVITSQPTEVLENNVLKQAGSFVSGVADLNALGTTFFGPAGGYVFTATSQSAKSGQSPSIVIQSVAVDSFSLSSNNLIRGENFSVLFRATNQAPADFILNSVKLLAAGREIFLTIPNLPAAIDSSQTQSFSATGSIHSDFPLGRFAVQLELIGKYAGNLSIKTPVLDSISVADSMYLRPVVGSLYYKRLSKGRIYQQKLAVVNQSNFDVVLEPATILVAMESSSSHSIQISDFTLLPKNAEAQILFKPDSFPQTFPSGTAQLSLLVSGRRDGLSFSDSFSVGENLILERPAIIKYDTGTLYPIIALPQDSFLLELKNEGGAFYLPDSLTRLLLTRPGDTVAIRLFGVGGTSAEHLNFKTRDNSDAPSGLSWQPILKLSGKENEITTTFELTNLEPVLLFSQPQIALETLWTVPRVNSDQSFPIYFKLFNPSAESLISTKVVLLDDGGALDSLVVPALAPNQSQEQTLAVPADSSLIGWTTYLLEVRPGKGKLTNATAVLDASVDRLTVLRQRKAVLELEPKVDSPGFPQNGILLARQSLTLSVHLSNFGEAPVSSGQIRLRVTPPLLTFISDSQASITPHQPATFYLQVQDTLDSVRVETIWLQVPLDSNSGVPAALSPDINVLSFKILRGLGALEVGASETLKPLLFSGQPVSPFSLSFTSNDFTGLHTFLLKKIAVEVQGPVSAFEEARLFDGSRVESATVEGNRLVFNFSPPVVIGTGESKNFSFSLRPKDQNSSSLRFSTKENLIEAIDSIPNSPPVPALLLAANGQPFAFNSSVFTTASGSSLATSLVTYPNPFSPPSEKLQIAYRLSAASEVEVKIYTLTGELVMEKTYSAGIEGGRAGINQIEWDGCNGKGREVKNGVYLAVIRSKATGETVKQKLAIVK